MVILSTDRRRLEIWTCSGSPNARATVTRRSSTQDGLRSDPTGPVAFRLLRYRRSNHQGMSLW